MYPLNYLKYLCLIFLVCASIGTSQNVSGNHKDIFVDDNGIMRWKEDNTEVSLFGVNYTTPFAYSYRAHKKLGLSLKKSIDIDVAQMVRLGLDAFRVHVWDREISDKDGNIINNEHLDLFDYLLSKLEVNNIKIIITPIAWWGNGWPEPDEKTKGFSDFFSKKELITNQEARRSERNYLSQFVNHFNPYTKTTYKNDPSVIAMEIINEPFHPDNGKDVTDYINEMVKVIRDAGYSKPLFYNISQNWNEVQAQAVCNADIQGISFQWYPTDLVHNKMLNGNYLINVNHYSIPSDSIVGYNKKAKMVYEFEAADIGSSYMYPAMARSFRESSMQFATMFAYDPSQIAWSNTEYPTHFLNLLYTPSKAISLFIASGVFHSLPLGKSFGSYPANNKFGNFHVDFENDLSIMNSDTSFYYSNSTNDVPVNPSALKHIAGCGNSSLVKYDGTGAYFLDKLIDGVWKLEVYPDVLWLNDPFKPTSLSRQVARLYWNQRKISLLLPGLGNNFAITQLDSRKRNYTKSLNSECSLKPGVYLLTRNDIGKERIKKYSSLKISFLNGLYTPPPETIPVSVVNFTQHYQAESEFRNFNFKIASEQKITDADLYIKRIGRRGFAKYPLHFVSGFDYAFTDSLRKINSGEIQFCVSFKLNNKEYTFPGGIPGSPGNWDFYSEDLWNTDILQPGELISLLDVTRDRGDFVFPHFNPLMRYNIEYKNGPWKKSSVSVGITYSKNNIIPFGLQLNVSGLVHSLKNIVNEYKYVVIRARSIKESNTTIGLNFLSEEGKNFGAEIELTNEWKDIEVPLSSFKSCSALVLPASYPSFLPEIWNSAVEDKKPFKDVNMTGSIQITCGNQNSKSSDEKSETGFEIESVWLKK
jgi:hypothetical protein